MKTMKLKNIFKQSIVTLSLLTLVTTSVTLAPQQARAEQSDKALQEKVEQTINKIKIAQAAVDGENSLLNKGSMALYAAAMTDGLQMVDEVASAKISDDEKNIYLVG